VAIESASPENDASAAESHQHSEPESPINRTVELTRAVELEWSSFFLVQRKSTADQQDAPARPVLLAPGHLGLDFFDDLEDIEHLWFVSAIKKGILTTERVERLRFWRLASEQDETYLTALQCQSGAMLVVAGDQVYTVDEDLAKWVTEGDLKCATTQLDTLQVDAVVIGEPGDRDVVTVRSDDGVEYSITSSTRGVELLALQEGTRVHCVLPRNQRVLQAHILQQCTSGGVTDG
jgi:hypothetical protein